MVMREKREMASPCLSVVISTFRRTEELERCLDSFTRQTLAADLFEVIVVDNNSGDNTPQLVQSFMGRIPNLRYVLELKQGASHARNRGAIEAQSEFLLFIDDDAKVPEGYLERQYANVQTYQPDILGGAIFPYYTTPKPKWFKDQYEIRKHLDKAAFSLTCRVTGSNYGIRKTVLQRIGMFNPEFGPNGGKMGMLEEWIVLDLYRRSTPVDEQKVFYDPDAFVYHHCPDRNMHLRYILRRGFMTGWNRGRLYALDRTFTEGFFVRGGIDRLRVRISIRIMALPLQFVTFFLRAALRNRSEPFDAVIQLKRWFSYFGRTLAEWKYAFMK